MQDSRALQHRSPGLFKGKRHDTEGQLSLLLGVYKKGDGAPLHLHDMDETFYVLEGEFLFQSGDERFKATLGDTIFIKRNRPHTYLTLSSQAKMLFMFTPSKFAERLFAKLSLATSQPTTKELEELENDFGLKIVGPPITE